MKGGRLGRGSVADVAGRAAHTAPSVIPAQAGIQSGSRACRTDLDPGLRQGDAPFHAMQCPSIIPAKSLPRTRYGSGI